LGELGKPLLDVLDAIRQCQQREMIVAAAAAAEVVLLGIYFWYNRVLKLLYTSLYAPNSLGFMRCSLPLCRVIDVVWGNAERARNLLLDIIALASTVFQYETGFRLISLICARDRASRDLTG
jgi:hypothetical protein